jgi:hypothetical protein
MIIAIHQPNFIPWFPYFEKMNLCDKFIILAQCQFEKNGWQNRCETHGRYWTKPVQHGLDLISRKKYVDGQSLYTVNMYWIDAIASTLGLRDKIDYDFPTTAVGSERLVDIVKHFKGDAYLTNMDAFDKYLDRTPFDREGIKIIPFEAEHKMHTFEMFNKFGIGDTIKILERQKKDALCRI